VWDGHSCPVMVQLIVILNKRPLRSEEPVPSLPRESGRAARRVAFFCDPLIARSARFLINLQQYVRRL
jgi:hypothetical protein